MLRANFHTHCTMCDGTSTMEEMLDAALAKGFEQLGFSSHVDPDIPLDWAAYSARVHELSAAYAGRIDILLGAELDNLWGPERCPGAEYLIGSTHYLPVGEPSKSSVDISPEILEGCCREWYGGDWYALTAAYYEFHAQVVERTGCTFIGHFDLVTRFNDQMRAFDETDPRYLRPALEAMEHLASHDVPFEINCGAINRGRKAEPYPRCELLQALRGFGGEIVISSDAHEAGLIDGGFAQAIALALECGFTHTNILAHDAFGGIEWRQLALDSL